MELLNYENGELEIDVGVFREHLGDLCDEEINALAEKILRKRGIEPDEDGFYNMETREGIIDEFLPKGNYLEYLIWEMIYLKILYEMTQEGI